MTTFQASTGAAIGAPLKAPTGVTATVGDAASITVSWAAVAGATSYTVYRGTTDDPTAATVLQTGVTGTSHVDATAPQEAAAYYWVVAVHPTGSSAKSGLATGWRVADAPGAFTMAATTGQVGYIEVTWTASAGALFYEVYRDGTRAATIAAGDPRVFTDEVPGEIVSHTDYVYEVFAVNYTARVSGGTDTGSANDPVPVAPSGLAATDGTEEVLVTLTWETVDYADSYEVWRDGALLATVGGGGAGLHYDIVASGLAHTYKVKAVGESGSSGFSNEDSGYAAALSAPTGISSTDNTDMDKVTVTWNSVARADSYNVYRNGFLMATVSALTYDDTTGTVNTGYAYNVKAVVTGVQTSAYGTGDDGMRLQISAPTGVSATDTDLDQIEVTWSAATGAASYEVWRDGTQLATGLTSLSYTDSGVTVGVTYSYQVKAVRSASNVSNLSTADNGLRPQLAAPTGVSATTTQVGQVTVSWSAQSAATAGFEVYRNAAFLASVSAGVTSYVDSSGSDCVTSTYTVIAKRTGNNSAASTGANGRPVPSGEFCAGGGLSTSGAETAYDQSFTVCGGVTLNWYLNANSTIKDELILELDGGTIVSTGCIVGEASGSYGPLSSGSHTLRVRVVPHCDSGQSGTTAWSIAITCA